MYLGRYHKLFLANERSCETCLPAGLQLHYQQLQTNPRETSNDIRVYTYKHKPTVRIRTH